MTTMSWFTLLLLCHVRDQNVIPYLSGSPGLLVSGDTRQKQVCAYMRTSNHIGYRPGGWLLVVVFQFGHSLRRNGTPDVRAPTTNQQDRFQNSNICVSGNYSGIRDTIQFLSAI
jgi:hypothetical protein